MALFENFPYTNLHELNLDWLVKEINNLKEGQVLSVNGQTGNVVLYQNNDIIFPAVANTHWSMVRSTDGTTRGIMFGSDNKAYIVHGNTMEQIYSSTNQPPYPVESVNGKTGEIILFTDNNGVVSFPAVVNPDIEGIIIGRNLNGQALYLKLKDDGTAYITSGNNEEQIYTTADTNLNVFPLPEAETTETDTTNKQWGIVREVNSGDIGLMFNLGETPEVYIRFRDAGFSWQNVKLLTNDDIPSSSGVVSFNGQTGVVVVRGSDLIVSTTDIRTISQAITDLTNIDNNIKGSVAYIEDTDTASQNIPNGAYVIWKNNPYKTTSAISIGTTLSGSNLSAIPNGIANDLNSNLGRHIIKSFTLQSIAVTDGSPSSPSYITLDLSSYVPTGYSIYNAIVSVKNGNSWYNLPDFNNPADKYLLLERVGVDSLILKNTDTGWGTTDITITIFCRP